MRQLNGRNALSGSYLFSQFSYPGYSDTFEMNAALFGAERKWTRNLTTTVAGGPQWITSSTTTVVPSSTNVAANAAVSYRLRFASASVGYSRGANGGAGYLIGGQVDSLTGGLSRDFGTNFTLGLSGGFRRTAGLNNNGTTNGTFGEQRLPGIWAVASSYSPTTLEKIRRQLPTSQQRSESAAAGNWLRRWVFTREPRGKQ